MRLPFLFLFVSSKRKCSVSSMASVSRLARRKDASRWPRMSSTFWAVVLLTALLVLYCGKCRCSSFDHTYRHLEALITGAGAHWVTVSKCRDVLTAKWCHWYWQSLLLIPHVVLNRYWKTHPHTLKRTHAAIFSFLHSLTRIHRQALTDSYAEREG